MVSRKQRTVGVAEEYLAGEDSEAESVLDEVWDRSLITNSPEYSGMKPEEKVKALEDTLDAIALALNEYDNELYFIDDEDETPKSVHFVGEKVDESYCDGKKSATNSTNDLELVTCPACFQKMVRSLRILWISIFPEFLRYSAAYDALKAVIRPTSAGSGDTNEPSIAP
jgi:hypothetical protein